MAQLLKVAETQEDYQTIDGIDRVEGLELSHNQN